MAPVPEAPLADLWREADPEVVADFVGALFAARGYEVERVDDRLLRLDPGSRTIVVSPEGTQLPPEADAVVAADPRSVRTGRDTDVIDADALREQLAYGVDRSVARTLLAAHFGFEAGASYAGGSGVDEPTVTDTDSAAADTGYGSPAWQGNRLAIAIAAVAGIVLVGLAVGGVPAVPADGLTARLDGPSVAETPVRTPTVTATGTPQSASDGQNGQAIATAATPGAGTAQQSADAAAERLSRQHPPGIDGDGLTNIDRLIATHRSHLSNTSYTMTVEYREFDDGRVTGVYAETIRVENDSRYSVSVSTEGTIQTSPRAIVGADAFSNEQRAWLRLRSTEPYMQSRLSTTRFLGQTARYLRWSLSAEKSTLRDRRAAGNRTVYRVTTDGDPYQGIRDAAGTVYVTGDGLIQYGRWTYTTIRPEVRVEFVIRTTKVGATAVSRPGWVNTDQSQGDDESESKSDGGSG